MERKQKIASLRKLIEDKINESKKIQKTLDISTSSMAMAISQQPLFPVVPVSLDLKTEKKFC